MPKIKHGLSWPDETRDIDIEFWFIRKGKEWLEQRGDGLFNHYKALHSILWPGDIQHRWFLLALKSFCEEEIVVMMGSKDSGKTYSLSCFALMDYWAFPHETLWMISSTEYRGCEMRIWGDIKTLFNRAKTLFDDLPGEPLESMHAITTDSIDDDREFARSLKRGLILVPCKKGNQYVGLSAFQGVKSPRLRHGGDEVAAMSEGFLNSYSNWYGKRDFKGIMTGNPTDPEDQLCRAAEPLDGGWDHFVDTGKTQVWRSKFFNALAIAFDGRDSPNDDYPDSDKPRFHFLISKKGRDAVAKSFGEESWQVYSQCIGKPNKSVLLYRIITRQQCLENNALEDVMWDGSTPITDVFSLDPNYGGQDRCVGGRIQFGKDVSGNIVIAFHQPDIVPVKPALKPFDPEPETQIALYVKSQLKLHNIPASHAFYDSVGKGTLGYAFAKVFGDDSPNPIDSGMQPTARPVRFDLFVDEEDGTKRLKRCDEHYSKFVTEMYFSLGEAIRSKQVRQLPQESMKELCLRIYKPFGNKNRIEIEPKSGTPNKPGFIQRIGYSPDFADWAVIGVEGCRRLGFRIELIDKDARSNSKSKPQNQFLKDHQKFKELQQKRQLQSV